MTWYDVKIVSVCEGNDFLKYKIIIAEQEQEVKWTMTIWSMNTLNN